MLKFWRRRYLVEIGFASGNKVRHWFDSFKIIKKNGVLHQCDWKSHNLSFKSLDIDRIEYIRVIKVRGWVVK